MGKCIASVLCCALGLTGLARVAHAGDYVLINNIDAPNSADTTRTWNIGGMSVDGRIIGDDPGNTSGSVPTTAATSGYAVSPFSLANSLQGNATTAMVDQVSVVMNLQAPTMTGLMTGNVYGAFYKPGASNSLSSATLVGGFFQFAPGVGNGTVQILTANLTSMPVLNAGQTYWLVVAPKAGLNAQNSDTLTHYGVYLDNSAAALAKVGISNSTSYGTLNSELYEQMGAQAGDQLTADTNFFGTRIYAVAGVPEAPSLVTALLGLVPVALLIRRRRTA